MFFSVKTPVKILGKVYTPCICYEASDSLAPTIEKMVAEGKAYSYPERVAFQTGKVLPSLKEREAKAKAEKKAKKEGSKEVQSSDMKDNSLDEEGF